MTKRDKGTQTDTITAEKSTQTMIKNVSSTIVSPRVEQKCYRTRRPESNNIFSLCDKRKAEERPDTNTKKKLKTKAQKKWFHNLEGVVDDEHAELQVFREDVVAYPWILHCDSLEEFIDVERIRVMGNLIRNDVVIGCDEQRLDRCDLEELMGRINKAAILDEQIDEHSWEDDGKLESDKGISSIDCFCIRIFAMINN